MIQTKQNENLYVVFGIILNLFQIFSIVSAVNFMQNYFKTKHSTDTLKSNYPFYFYLFFSIIEILIFVFITIKSNGKNNEILSNKTILDTLLYSYSIYFCVKLLMRFIDIVSKLPILEQKGNPYVKYIKIFKFIKIILNTHSIVNFILVKLNIILPKKKRIFLGILIPISIYSFLQLFSYLAKKIRDRFKNTSYTKKVLHSIKKKEKLKKQHT